MQNNLESHAGIKAVLNACYWYKPCVKLSPSNHKRFLEKIGSELSKASYSIKYESSIEYPGTTRIRKGRLDLLARRKSTIGPINADIISIEFDQGPLLRTKSFLKLLLSDSNICFGIYVSRHTGRFELNLKKFGLIELITLYTKAQNKAKKALLKRKISNKIFLINVKRLYLLIHKYNLYKLNKTLFLIDIVTKKIKIMHL